MDNFSFEKSVNSIRKSIISTIYHAKKGHLGGALSSVDFIFYIFASQVVQPHPGGKKSFVKNPFVLSKAHSSTALLTVLQELFPDKAHSLKNYNRNGDLVGNNPSEMVFGVEFHAGSLGHGIGYGAGLALASKLRGDDRYVVVMVSDGELNEGSCWESLLFIARHKLNVCVVVDRNNQICENYIDDAVGLGDLSSKAQSFDLLVREIDGHSLSEFENVEDFIKNGGAPRMVILNTIKGKGVSFMESVVRFHHSIPTEKEYLEAMCELS